MRTSTIWLVTFFSMLQECIGMLTVVPKNTAVHEGNEAVLQCRTNSIGGQKEANTIKLLWRTQFAENLTISTIHTGNKFANNVSQELYDIIKTTKGQFDLRIKGCNTTARRYICEEPGVYNASAELIVLVSDPACSCTSVSNTSLRLGCRLHYFGNWAPMMEWRQVPGDMINEAKLIHDGITSNTSKYTVVSTLTVQRREQRSKYTCTTRFNASGQPALTTAANIPEYSYNWTYSDDVLHLSCTRVESTSTEQSSTTDISTNSTPKESHNADTLLPILISLIILCTLLLIIVCITYKKTNHGCIPKCVMPIRRQDITETDASVISNGVDESTTSPQVIDEDESNTYVQVWQGTNYLQLCPGSVSSLPIAKPNQGHEPPSSSRYFGDDGTEYMEMNGFRRQPARAPPPIHPTTLSTVVYAGIDHTLSSPPPNA